jgi:hypothetical protein
MKSTSHAEADHSLIARVGASLLAGVLCLGSGACASRTASSTVTPSQSMAARKNDSKGAAPQSIRITGSHIDQPLEDGVLPVTTSPVHVLTDRDIQRLGVANLAQALRRGVAGAR